MKATNEVAAPIVIADQITVAVVVTPQHAGMRLKPIKAANVVIRASITTETRLSKIEEEKTQEIDTSKRTRDRVQGQSQIVAHALLPRKSPHDNSDPGRQ